MNKFVYFMALGLAFTAMQVTTAEADHLDCAVPANATMAECMDASSGGDGDHPCSGMTGEALTTCRDTHRDQHENPCPDMTGAALTACMEANRDRHVMMDPRTDPPQPFSPEDEATYQQYADECESNGAISEPSMAILITPPHNFTRVQVEELCKDGAEHEHPAP